MRRKALAWVVGRLRGVRRDDVRVYLHNTTRHCLNNTDDHCLFNLRQLSSSCSHGVDTQVSYSSTVVGQRNIKSYYYFLTQQRKNSRQQQLNRRA